jgi:hypothetical protein
MSVAAIISTLDIINGVLGIAQFGIDNFAQKDDAGKTVVQLAVGLDVPGELSNAGGDLPDVRLFNEAGEFLGMTADPGDITDGTQGSVSVSTNGQQATYTLFSANNNAICIAYATITWPSGDKYAWSGNWGRRCGASWYYSNYYIKGTDIKPDCMWIDGDGDQEQTGFQIHWPEFYFESGDTAQAKDSSYYCDSGVAFGIRKEKDPSSITYWILSSAKRTVSDWIFGKRSQTGVTDSPHKKKVTDWTPRGRSTHVRRHNETNGQVGSTMFQDRLIKDNNPTHATADLCLSESSVGPDFLNVAEGQFCRMSDKTLWPLCNDEIRDDCFNVDLHQLIVGGIATRDNPYHNVEDWSN